MLVLAVAALVLAKMQAVEAELAREQAARAAAINEGLNKLPMGDFDKPALWNK